MMMNMRRPLQKRPFMRFPGKKDKAKEQSTSRSRRRKLKRETENNRAKET
jgi:hypothetical protein